MKGREESNAQVSTPRSGPVMHLLQKFLPGKTFAPIVTRDFRPPKPDPAGILHIAKAWGLEDGGNGLIMVLYFFFYSNLRVRPADRVVGRRLNRRHDSWA